MQTVVRQPTQTTTAGCRATEIISSVSTRLAFVGRVSPSSINIHALILLLFAGRRAAHMPQHGA